MDREELKRLTEGEMGRRIREGAKAVIGKVLEEEMTEHLAAGYRERTLSRRGEQNGHYTRDLITPAGRIAQLRVPRDREGAFLTEVFARYKRTTGEVAVRGAGTPKRTRAVGVFPSEGSLVNLARVVTPRATEDWAFRRYLVMGPLWAAEEKPTKIAT
ncbi:MAG: transposase [Thermus aquaticus]|uniref:transposase n=1 Tax=Thermus aquaticus TaxID=271 RepID=UPI003BFABFEA